MSQRKPAPSNWSAYERGRASSVGSLESITEGEAQQEYQGSPASPSVSRWFRGSERHHDGEHHLRPRASSIFESIRQIGGINNLDNFARSFQRAQAFREITPITRGSAMYAEDGEGAEAEEEADETRLGPERSLPNKSLLRQQFEAAQASVPEMAIADTASGHLHPEHTETSSLLPAPSRATLGSFSVRSRRGHDIPVDLGTSYGSISSRLTHVAQRRASILIQQHVEASLKAREEQEDGEEFKDNFLDRPVEIETRDDGEVVERLVGESTVPMTTFNSINVLIGVGVLTLPLGMKYCGWVIGLTFLTAPAFLTNYTAKLLAKCLDTNIGSTTYGDLAFLAFGDVGRAIVESLFVIELSGANVALLILFGDSMNSLIPSVTKLTWKALLAIVLIPLNQAPFRILSLTSILGILCTIGVILITFADGLIKPQSPGSLRDMMPTYAFPRDFRTVPLAIGLFVAPWAGHSVFPAVYKDMRHPHKYPKALRNSYFTVYGLDLSMAVFGYLMFGDAVKNQSSTNILEDPSYPKILSVLMVIAICILPVTKIPLSNRPVMDTINKKLMIDPRQMDIKARKISEKSWTHRSARFTVGAFCNLVELGLTILVPEFDSIMATMGASVCLTICAILPIAFYLKIFDSNGKEISRRERVMDWCIIVVASSMAILGTTFAIIPKDKIGARACQGIACMG